MGFSPCPNDTFIFYALANKLIDTGGLDFEFHIEDVETLNRMAVDRELDISKISCHAFYYLREDYQFLGAGGALGKGCGPLVVARDPKEFFSRKPGQELKIAIPGRLTTAALLLRLYFASFLDSQPLELIIMPFDNIMHSVSKGIVDAGLIIHESRFTFPSFGLSQIIDLGEWWEKETGLPIPLGGIAAQKSLGTKTIEEIENLIRSSINYASSHRSEAIPYIREYAREMDEDVMFRHIGLYVNEYTRELGANGRAALAELMRRAAGIHCHPPA